MPSRKNRRKNPSGNIVHFSWYFAECNQGVNWRNWSHIEARIVNECTCSSYFPSSELQWWKSVAFLLARLNSCLDVWKFERVSRIVRNVVKGGTGIAEHLILGTCPQQTKMCRTVILTMEYLWGLLGPLLESCSQRFCCKLCVRPLGTPPRCGYCGTLAGNAEHPVVSRTKKSEREYYFSDR